VFAAVFLRQAQLFTVRGPTPVRVLIVAALLLKLFFPPADAASANWPDGVKLLNVGQAEFQLRSLGLQHKGPAVVLVSGPNEHWHSDSGWFALLQPLLATKYRTYAIDRPGQGLSSDVADPSYRRFAGDLALVLAKLNEPDLVLISFASSSISALLYAQHTQPKNLRGMLLIDPDIPMTQSLALYKGYPADWYQANLAKLLPVLQSGQWTDRTATKLKQERQHVMQLIPPQLQGWMDWRYFDFMAQQRLSIHRQQSRAKEIAAYPADLELYQRLPLYTAKAVSVMNSDFELMLVEQNPQQKQQLLAWKKESDMWSQRQAQQAGGQYIELTQADHLLTFQHPDRIVKAVDWFMQLATDKK
jgi:polyhydroxybutyrate depolymerase